MAGILAAVASAVKVLDVVSSGDNIPKDLLEVLNSKEYRLIKTDGSIIKLLNKYIVEPTIVVSNDLRQEDVIEKIIQLESDMFAGFYMQAFNVMTNVDDLSFPVAFDSLSTDTGGLTRALLSGATLAVEDRDYLKEIFEDGFTLSIEAAGKYGPRTNPRHAKPKNKIDQATALRASEFQHRKNMDENNAKYKAEQDKKNFEYKEKMDAQRRQDEIDKENRLAKNPNYNAAVSSNMKDLEVPAGIQRYIDITVKAKNGTELIIPVLIKANILFTSITNIMNVLETNSYEKSFGARFDDYRAGAISLVDLIFAGDLIKEYKDNRLKDKDDLLKVINSRVTSANSKMIDNKFAGFEKYYNMYIVTESDKIRIENKLKGKLKNDRTKQKFLEQTYGLAVTVVDRDHERVRIALKDLRGATDITYRGLSKACKGGNDIEQIVKSLMVGKPPVF